jgi:SNF2 family DNA or RNA helicase
MPKLERGPGQLELTFYGYKDYMNHEAAVKAVPGRRFQAEGERKFWAFPEDPSVAERLMVTVKPEVSADLLGWVKMAKKEKQLELVTPLPDDADLLIPWGNQRVAWQPEEVGKRDDRKPFTSLYAYQRAFVSFAAEHPRVLLADDMGLGKCGQALSTVYEHLLSESKLAIEPGTIPTDGFSHAAEMLKWAGLEDRPKLIISPNSVKGTWAREIRMWLGEEEPHVIVDGSTPKSRSKQLAEGIAANGWVIVNWEQLRTKKVMVKKRKKMVHPLTREFIRWKEVQAETEVLREPLFEDTDWIAVIADEAHRAKNRKSLTAKGLFRISGDLQLAMTGTPLMNSPDELWPLLKWLFPDEYTSYWRFFDQYVEFYEGQYGKIVTGVRNPDALRFELSTRLVRRTKDEVLDLPEKTRVYVPVKMGSKQQKLYDEAEREMWFEVEQAIKAGDKAAEKFAEAVAKDPSAIYTVPNGAARTVRLRQIASTPALLGGEDESAKLDAAVEIIVDAQPKQIVFFTEFVGTTNIMVERLRKKGIRAEAFTGETDTIDRTRLENEFQAGDFDVLCGTIDAMKEGLTLTAADTQVWAERKWTPAPNEQGEDRSHRNGQDKPVTILILEADGTVDVSKVRPTNQIKSMIVSSVIVKDEVLEK